MYMSKYSIPVSELADAGFAMKDTRFISHPAAATI